MSSACLFERLQITDDDVAWVCSLLGLPENAFGSANESDARLQILKSHETMDIEACPGSGKTTLLVAKLAILARKWTDVSRGMCVLSHTNVARREIEQRLGNTGVGRQLLSYPHFVGTIHSFVNQFLAIPWLRSKPYPIRMIDDTVTLSWRWNRLPAGIRSTLQKKRDSLNLLRIAGTDFDVGNVSWGNGKILKKDTRTYRALRAACRGSCQEGYFCYDEMFLWANELLDQVPSVVEVLRTRFPMLFIDEVQDNNELQSAILFRLFVQGSNPVVRQRFGDANQAIYNSAGESTGATTDQFPNAQIRKDIPCSHRFGQEIADLANPLALEPQNLVGSGPSSKAITTDTTGRHAIFLFNDQTIGNVFATYAQYLIDAFSESELQAGIFTAVGAVHRLQEHGHLPRCVSHYWQGYDCELSGPDPRPTTFCQYAMAGQRLAHETHEAYHVVEKVAEGMLRLVYLAYPLIDPVDARRRHNSVLRLLADKPEARHRYRELVTEIAAKRHELTADKWNGEWCGIVQGIAEAITGARLCPERVERFLAWPFMSGEVQDADCLQKRGNVFEYPVEKPRVRVKVGSIHSVKGETHTATLVLETYYFGHHLVSLKPWLLGQKSGRGREGIRNLSRLRQLYVAMTRPSHLLCMAARADTFSEGEIDQLMSVSWRVARVTDASPTWIQSGGDAFG